MLGPYSIYKGEKEETIEMPEDISLWSQEIMDTLLQTSPYLNNVNLTINLFYLDKDKLNAFGVVQGEVGNITFEIPVVILNRKLHPIDVFFVNGEAYPLNPAILNRVLTQRSTMGDQAVGKVDPFKDYRESLPVGYTDIHLPSKRASDYISWIIDDLVKKEKNAIWKNGFIYKMASQERAAEVIKTIERDYVLSNRFREIYPDLYKESHFVAYTGRFPEDVWVFIKKNNELSYKRANDRAFVPIKNDIFLKFLTMEKEASYRYDDNTYIIDTRLSTPKTKLLTKVAATEPTQTVNTDGDYIVSKHGNIAGLKLISSVYGYNNKPTNLVIGIIPSDTNSYVIATDIDTYGPSPEPVDFKVNEVTYNAFVKDKEEKPEIYTKTELRDIIPLRINDDGKIQAWLPVFSPKITAYKNMDIVVIRGNTMFGEIRLVWGKNCEQPVNLPRGTEYGPGLFIDDIRTILMPRDVLVVYADQTNVDKVKPKTGEGQLAKIAVDKNSYGDWKIDLTMLDGPSTDYSLSQVDVVANLIKYGFDIDDIVKILANPDEWYVVTYKQATDNTIAPPQMPIDAIAKAAVSIGKQFPNIGKFIFSLLYVSPENINQYNKAISQIVDALDVMVKFLILARLGNINTDLNSLKTAIEYTADFLTKLNKIPYKQVAPANVISEEREQVM